MLGVTTAAIVTRGSSSILKQEGARFGGRSFAARFPARRTNFAERLGEDRFIASSRDAFSAQSEDQRVADGVQKWKKPRGSWGFFLKSPRGEGSDGTGENHQRLKLITLRRAAVRSLCPMYKMPRCEDRVRISEATWLSRPGTRTSLSPKVDPPALP